MKPIYLIILIFISSCFNKDEGGSGYFFAQNNSVQNVFVTYKLLPEHGSFEDTVDLALDSKVELYHLFEIGVNPKPSDAFQFIYILDENYNTLLVQDPIDDSQWQADQLFKRSYGRTNYYLVFE
jgi:hypothetical protein